MTGSDWMDLAVMATHLVAALAWLALLGFVTFASWQLVRLPDSALRGRVRAVRARVLPWLWGFIAVLVITGAYNQLRNVPFPLPRPWHVNTLPASLDRAYVLLLLGKHLLIAEMAAGLAVVTRRARGRATSAPPAHAASERGTALVSSMSLASGVLVLLVAVALNYVHVLAHGHGGT